MVSNGGEWVIGVREMFYGVSGRATWVREMFYDGGEWVIGVSEMFYDTGG